MCTRVSTKTWLILAIIAAAICIAIAVGVGVAIGVASSSSCSSSDPALIKTVPSITPLQEQPQTTNESTTTTTTTTTTSTTQQEPYQQVTWPTLEKQECLFDISSKRLLPWLAEQVYDVNAVIRLAWSNDEDKDEMQNNNNNM